MEITIDILGIAAVLSALGVIVGTVWGVIKPIRAMLTRYEQALQSANTEIKEASAQIAEQAEINKAQNALIDESKTDRLLIGETLDDILSYMLMTECARAIRKGYRSLGTSKDIDRIHRRYRARGLNGAGEDIYVRYLRLEPKDLAPMAQKEGK